MTYSAKALFSDWYNTGLKRDSPVLELQSRRAIIETILKESGGILWVGILKIYLGFSSEKNQEYVDLVEKFKSNDEYFSVQDNNLLRLLAGCLIAEKIEENKSFVSDFLALGICTFLKYKLEILPELLPLAEQFWINECEKKRELSFTDGPTKLTQSFSKVAITAAAEGQDPVTALVADTTKQLGLVLKDTNSLLVNSNILISLINELQTNHKYLAEETNVLWWIFTGYSGLVSKKFVEITPGLLSIVVPIELYNLSVNLPGLGKIDRFVERVFDLAGATIETIPIEDIAKAIGSETDLILASLPELESSIVEFCPCLNVVNTYLEFAGNEWKTIYNKKDGINLSTSFHLSTFSNQLYKELMLIQVWESLEK